jgi:hypothetical protein
MKVAISRAVVKLSSETLLCHECDALAYLFEEGLPPLSVV